MIAAKKVLAVISARGGSKGIPRKNIRAVAGKPLIGWTIEEAKKSRYIDRLVVSSEDAEIIAICRDLGCDAPFVRPAALARDDTPGVEPVLHALDQLPGYDLVVLLQPTSPLRKCEDIDGCIALCHEHGADSCVSVTEPAHHPHWMFTLDASRRLRPLVENAAVRRQDLPTVYGLNGAIYVAKTNALRDAGTFLMEGTIAYVMAQDRSLDIDSEFDMALANCLLASAD